MKFTSTIVIVLVAASLALAEAAPTKEDALALRERIFLHVRKGAEMAGKFAKRYMELADSEETSELDSGRYALASKLMNAAGYTPWDEMTFALHDDITSDDLVAGVGRFNLHADMIQSKVDVKLESLIKLAAELPAGNGIAKDVKEVIKAIDGNINFINALFDEISPKQS